MDTRIIILSDNRTDNPLLETEHGLSVYLEYNGRKYLLDTGASDLFMRNAEKLGVDLSEVDYCLISHGHNDHIGGLPAFLEVNHKAKVILSSEIPGAEYASVRRYLHSITFLICMFTGTKGDAFWFQESRNSRLCFCLRLRTSFVRAGAM